MSYSEPGDSFTLQDYRNWIRRSSADRKQFGIWYCKYMWKKKLSTKELKVPPLYLYRVSSIFISGLYCPLYICNLFNLIEVLSVNQIIIRGNCTFVAVLCETRPEKRPGSIVYLIDTLAAELTTAVNGAHGMFDVSDAFMKTGTRQHRHRVCASASVKANAAFGSMRLGRVCGYIRSKALVVLSIYTFRCSIIVVPRCATEPP